MGMDVTGLRIDRKVNEKTNDSTRVAILVAPKASPEIDGSPEEKIINTEAYGSTDEQASTLAKPENGPINTGHADGAEDDGSGLKVSSKSSDLDSPTSGKKSHAHTHFVSRKPMCDEEDNWSLASSTATSARAKITVPVAPKFSCVDRLERRKEFYTKLEEKHKALEKEKLEYEARIKEEEQAAIKQMRKSMVVKANPVPSFYREGPPPKVELKKLPVTRAKSPNLTRRKSCGDAAKPSPEANGRVARHSVGPTPKKASLVLPKSRTARPNGPKKVKNPQPKDENGDT